jgi:Tol biopolymer transport system component
VLGVRAAAVGRSSHDMKRYAIGVVDVNSRNADIWVSDLARGSSSRLTFNPAIEGNPVWSPGDDSIVFSSSRSGKYFDLYVRSSNGTGEDQLFLQGSEDKTVADWSLDGRYLLVGTTGNSRTKADIHVLPLSGERKLTPFLTSEFREIPGTFSPDARWIVYVSDETQRAEVYVRPFGGAEGKWQISTSGGLNPRWSGDGKEIFFVSTDRKLMSAHVRITTAGLVTDSVTTMFPLESRGIVGTNFDAARDGKTFHFLIADDQQSSVPITLVINWQEALKKP